MQYRAVPTQHARGHAIPAVIGPPQLRSIPGLSFLS